MSKHFRVNTLIAGKLVELGLDPADVLRNAGLPEGLMALPKAYVTTEEFFALWRAIGALSGDPAIGLKLGSEERIERYDPIAIAALYTPTFGEALQRMARYKQLTCPEEIRIVPGPEQTSVQFCWLLATDEEPACLVDLCFAWVLSIARRGTGARVMPSRIELMRPRAHARALEQYFRCPVEFGAAGNAMCFRNDELRRPFLTHNAELLAMIAPQLEQELRERDAAEHFPDRIRRILKRQLAGQRPTLQVLARELKMSARSLQRRLTAEGTSFQQALEEARRELARHYLIHSSLELNETAYLLGYEDANSFVRAFRTWEGLPPAAWRASQRAEAPAFG